MDPELAKKALDAIEKGDMAALASLMKDILIAAASGTSPAAAPDPAALADPAAPGADDKEDPEVAALTALGRTLVQLSGRSTAGEASTFYTDLVQGVQAAAKDRAVVELSERRGLVARLITCGAETPPTAFKPGADGLVPDDGKAELCDRLMREQLSELRSRTVQIELARGVQPPRAHTPPAAPPLKAGTLRKLNRAEEAFCKKHQLSREQFEARKAEATRSA